MSNSFTNAGLFLINTLFDLYLFVLVARLILAWSRADSFNPITRFILNVTPFIKPLRRVIPTYAGIEFATLAAIILLEVLKLFLLTWLMADFLDFVTLFMLAINNTLKLILNTFFYAIFIQAILSWIQPGYSPLTQILMYITEPLLRPLRRVIPPIGGFDITPIPALIILQLLIILL